MTYNFHENQRVRLARPHPRLGVAVGTLGTVVRGFAGRLGVTFDGDDAARSYISVEDRTRGQVAVIDLCQPVEENDTVVRLAADKAAPRSAWLETTQAVVDMSAWVLWYVTACAIKAGDVVFTLERDANGTKKTLPFEVLTVAKDSRFGLNFTLRNLHTGEVRTEWNTETGVAILYAPKPTPKKRAKRSKR